MTNIQFGKIPIFPNYSLVGGYQKRQKALKLLGFLYGGSSIHWPPKPILSSSIFSHLFPFNFFPYISISIFISHICSPYFLSLKNFFSSSNLSYYFQFHTIRKKIFLHASPNPKNPLSSPISKPTYFKFK